MMDLEERTIDNQEKIVNFIERVVESPNEKFGNLPACPFAKKERLNKELLFKEFEFGTIPCPELINLIKEVFITKVDYTLLIFDTCSQMDIQTFRDYCTSICEKLKEEKIIAAAMHPLDSFNIDGYYTRQAPFHIILIQFASEILRGRELLAKTNYYKNWKDNDRQILDDQFGKFLL